MQKAGITGETFVRQMPHSAYMRLADFLDYNNLWEALASKIPMCPDDIFNSSDGKIEFRYTMSHIAKLGSRGCRRGESSTVSLLRDWGQQNCKIKHLVEALYQAELISAAAYIERELLHIEPGRQRSQHSGENSSSDNPDHSQDSNGISNDQGISIRRGISTGAAVEKSCMPPPMQSPPKDVSFESGKSSRCCISRECESSESTVDGPVLQHFSSEQKTGGLVSPAPLGDCHMEETLTVDVNDITQLKEIPFTTLKAITNDFDHRNYKDGGNLIGEGGFGKVFIGIFSTGYKVAVKCLKDHEDSLEQFKIEMEALSKFRHENLVYLLGYSADENSPCCLIYQYMPNGSLEERLACRYNTPALPNDVRLEIIKGTARGIVFLHEGGLVHRDIKTANILLDANFKPKVGDFATARVLPKGMATTFMKASVVIGTVSYLAPEALSFVIHPSLDSFSFGVVILEILTGLPVTDPNRDESDLKIHVQEHCCAGEDDEEAGTIFDLLDTKGGQWSNPVVEGLYSISCRCLDLARKKRPKMADILSELEKLSQTDEVSEVH